MLLDAVNVKGRRWQGAGGVKIVVKGRSDNVDVRVDVKRGAEDDADLRAVVVDGRMTDVKTTVTGARLFVPDAVSVTTDVISCVGIVNAEPIETTCLSTNGTLAVPNMLAVDSRITRFYQCALSQTRKD